MPQPLSDPIKAREKFNADLAFMAGGSGPDGKPKPIKQRMNAKNFGLNIGGFKRNRWFAELEEKQTLDDALDPTFWVAQADEIMRPAHKGLGDIIEIHKPDTGLYAELKVSETGKGFVKAVVVREAKPEEVVLPENSALTTKWNVGARSHDVIRAADKQVLASGFQTKAAAAVWIADHLKKMAA